MTLCERIRLVKRKNVRRANCIGTALYLAGILEQEFSVTSREVKDWVKDLAVLKEPEVPCLVIFKDSSDWYIPHMGIITGIDPLQMTHRDGFDGPFFENELVKKVLKRYRRLEDVRKVEYRRITLP